MHLMTFMELAQQRWHQRVMVVCGQGVFFAGYTIFYVLTPRIAHRFVGYLEEEAIHNCRKCGSSNQHSHNGETKGRAHLHRDAQHGRSPQSFGEQFQHDHTKNEHFPHQVDQGKIKNVPAPKIAIQYWNMPADATLRDVVLVVAQLPIP